MVMERLREKLDIRRLAESRALRFIMHYLLIFVLLAVFLLFVLATGGRFVTPGTIEQILITSASLGVMSIGFMFPLIAGKIDLTPGATAGWTVMFGAWLCGYQPITSGLRVNPYLTMFIIVLMGCAVGLVNGLLINKGKLSDFMTTLAMLIALTGLTAEIVRGEPQYNYPQEYNALGKASFGGIPIQLIIVIIFVVVSYLILKRTKFGTHVYLSGDNENAARAMGINVDRVRIICYIISGLAAAVAGLMIAGRVASVRPAFGEGLIFLVFAATIVGGVSLRGGTGLSPGVWVGAVLFSMFTIGFQFIGFPSEMIDLFVGMLLIIILAVDVFKRKLGV